MSKKYFTVLIILFTLFASISKAEIQMTIQLQSGWNMVSLPINTTISTNDMKSQCGVNVKIWSYNPVSKNYESDSEIRPGSGYWVKLDSVCSVSVTGSTVQSLSDLKAGWNQIGALSATTDFNSVKGSCNVKSGPFKYNPASRSYVKTTSLESGYGYWLNVGNDCELSSTTPTTCSDGTYYDQCSSSKPKFCVNGNLIDKCTQCLCPSGQSCNTTTNSCYTPVLQCSDGTIYGSCSSNKPMYCDNGSLINNCFICGCPSGQSCNTTTKSCYIPANNHLFYVVYHDILVDSNGHPNNNAQRIANAHPTYVHTYAEISGNNIPQEVRDFMHNNGVKILCYVKSAPPDSTSPPFSDAQIRSEIKTSMDLGCDGIMFDNVRANFGSYYDIYKGWRDYVKTWGSDKIAWFNTGHSNMDESIMQVADIVEVEHHINDLVTDSPWVTKYPSTRFAANVVSWEDLNYYPLPSGITTSDSANKVTLEKAIQYTTDCWNAGHIAYMYSGNILNSVGWLPTWFEDYVSSI